MPFCLEKRVALVFADRVRSCNAGDASHRVAHENRRMAATARLDDVCRHLSEAGFDVTKIARAALSDDIATFDWIVALGGDGTQLDTARFAGTTPVLGLKMFPESSRGFLCTSDYDVFLAQSHNIGDSCRIDSRMRLCCSVNGTQVGRSILNDVLFSQENPARASRYILSFRGAREFQCSSGVWVSTAIGSHGAVRSAGGPTIDCSDRMAAYCVRELAHEGALRQGTFDPHEDLSIVVEGRQHKLFFDGGLWECSLAPGDVVTFSESADDYRQITI